PLVAQQILFVFDHLARRVAGPLEVVAVIDGVGRAGVHAEAAQNAAPVINLINLGVAMVYADALFVWALVFRAFDVDRVRRASRRAEETRDAFLFAVFVDIQEVLAAEPAIDYHRIVRVTDGLFFGWDVAQGDG